MVSSIIHRYSLNPFTADPVKAVDLLIIFNFWHSGGLALRTERQTARMSEIKNSGLDHAVWRRTL